VGLLKFRAVASFEWVLRSFAEVQNVERQNVERQNVERQNVERQNVERQNVERQNVKCQIDDIKMQTSIIALPYLL
jgi:hypothetical protein